MERSGYNCRAVLLSMCSLVIVMSCVHKAENKDVDIICPLSATKEVYELDKYIRDVQVIPIVSDSLIFSGISKMIVSDKRYIILSGGVVFSVSFDGRSVCRIGNVGRGPGEYLSVKDIAINVYNDEIWCLDILNEVLRYDLQSGKYIASCEQDENGYATAIIPLDNNSFALYFPNPRDEDLTKRHVKFYSYREYDSDGNILNQGMPWNEFALETNFVQPLSYTADSCSVFASGSSDPIVVYKHGHIREKIKLDFGIYNVPENYFKSRSINPYILAEQLFEQDYFKLVSSVYILGNDIYFQAFGKQSSSWNFFFERGTDKGIRWRAVPTAGPPQNAIGSDGEYLYYEYESLGRFSMSEEQDPLMRAVLKRYGQLMEEANNYIIKLKIQL